MRRRLAPYLLLALLVSTIATPLPASAGSGSATEGPTATMGGQRPAYRPDAWIKLCGLSTGCTIDPLPHPWRGNNVYNGTGVRQKVSVRLDNGEGVRFWLTLQNDGTQGDSFILTGCPGTPKFRVNAVLIGLYKRPDWRAEKITKEFKAGGTEFAFPPWSDGKTVKVTVNFVSSDNSVGASYRCPIKLSASSDPSATDTVVAAMSAY